MSEAKRLNNCSPVGAMQDRGDAQLTEGFVENGDRDMMHASGEKSRSAVGSLCGKSRWMQSLQISFKWMGWYAIDCLWVL